jgi:LysR family transcriptional activator of nhaA
MYLRQAGVGTFASPAAVEEEVRKYYRVALIGRLDSAKENFNAISAELKINHPAIAAISEAARQSLFTNHAKRSHG